MAAVPTETSYSPASLLGGGAYGLCPILLVPTDLFYEATDDANPCSTGVGDRDNGYFEPFLGSQNKFVKSDLRGYPGPHLRNSLPKPEAGETTNYLWHWSLRDMGRGGGDCF